ncbi:phosphatase PAP2 family protein [Alkalilimnicola ehrlichii]|uniref:phosphatase PAP2 family protein n=1 Tax=Alkalilimnicola ehrlichii TaxID=351052 RepID=UPI0015F2536D|nr:phosphatase PAP2 family protein [Alkalilimnicola ehrlichii]
MRFIRALTLLCAGVLLALPASQARAQEVIEVTGNALRVFLPAAAWAATYVDQDGEGRDQFYWALGSTVVTTVALKLAVDSEGPDGQAYAFPSGHTSMAFSSASFIQRRYGWRYAWPIYGLAGVVGWSQLESDQADWEDVVAGAAIGFAFTWLFVEPRPEDNPVEFSVNVAPDEYSVGVRWRW